MKYLAPSQAILSKKIKRWTVMLAIATTVVLLVGVLFHSITLLTLNTLYPPPTTLTAESLIFIDTTFNASGARLDWIVLARQTASLCGTIYFIGGIVALVLAYRELLPILFRQLALFYVATYTALLLCTLPFAVRDPINICFGNYFGDVVSNLCYPILFFIAACIVNGIKKYQYRKMGILNPFSRRKE